MTVWGRMVSAAVVTGIASIWALGLAATLPPKGSLRVNVNTATELELQSLPDVGPARAAAIVLGRPYRQVRDLARVKGISPSMVRSWARLLTVHDPTGPVPSRQAAQPAH